MFCVVPQSQISHLKQIVHDVDPNAFVAIMEVTETLGQGFKELGTRFDDTTVECFKAVEDGYYGLRDVTFKVEPGQFVFLTGESGAGKSTAILRMIYRAERPTSGTVLVDGIDTAAAHGSSLTALRRKIGMVFQDYMLLFDRTVAENVALPLVVRGVDKHAAAAQVDSLPRQGRTVRIPEAGVLLPLGRREATRRPGTGAHLEA